MAKKRTSCSNIGEDSKRTVTSIILLLRPSGLSLSHQPVKSRHECIYTSFVIKGRSRRARELVRLCNRVSCGKLDGSVKPSERARRKKGRRGEGRDGGREKGRKEGRKEERGICAKFLCPLVSLGQFKWRKMKLKICTRRDEISDNCNI